jgi:tetratricopeptide (TPR) repeat protein
MQFTFDHTKGLRQQDWLAKLQSVLQTSGPAAAAPLALQAIKAGVEHPGVINLAASAHFNEGRFEDAIELLNRARIKAPSDPQLLNSIGLCLKSLGRLDEALEAFDRALAINTSMVSAHFNRGLVLEEQKNLKHARSAYERAVALDPNKVDALACIAWLDAQAGNITAARQNGENAIARDPFNVVARLALASADLQAGELDAAESGLSAMNQEKGLEQQDRAIMLGLLGDLRDAQGRTGEAFAAYQSSNSVQRALYASQYDAPGATTALDQAQRLISWFEGEQPQVWREAPAAGPDSRAPKAHVFLVGFPRSGTTLLENVLAAHPDVASLEERNCLTSAFATYMSSADGVKQLAHIGPADAAREREIYWSKVRSHGVEPRGRVFIDKLPLSSVALPLIAKLFPSARILFARRDPRDVVLSCFRRRFAMNPAMYQLLTLEGAAAYYDAVMRLSDVYRQLLPLQQHIVRYESLVESFEQTARAACDFLGLPWNERQTEFAASAVSRAIATPSAAQVARGLNSEGVGTWRRYADQMAPVLPVLEPWVMQLGY